MWFSESVKPLRPDQGERLIAHLREYEAGGVSGAQEPDRAMAGRMARLAERHTHARQRWRFSMFDPEVWNEVQDYLLSNAPRPVVAVRLVSKMFVALDEEGYVAKSRAELAAELGVDARAVTRVVSLLVKIGAMRRDKSGIGVRYQMNPWIACRLPRKAREEAQRGWRPPLLASSAPDDRPVELRRRAALRPALML